MPDVVMIKLSVLLLPAADEAARQRLLGWLHARGIKVTGSGARTVSAQVAVAHFADCFGGMAPTAQGGFVNALSNDASVPIPAALRDVVGLITFVPPHAIHVKDCR